MPKPEQLRRAAIARAEGRSWEEISTLPGMPSKRTLLTWSENDLIPIPADDPLRGTDVLLGILSNPTTPPAVLRAAATDYENLLQKRHLLDGTDDDGQSRVVNVTFSSSGCPYCTCPECTARHAPPPELLRHRAGPDCLDPHLHAISNGYGRNRQCGCPA